MSSPLQVDSLLNHRLLFTVGKGGVGKTTLSLALGLLAAKKGKRTLIVEVNSEEQVAHLLERPPIGYNEAELVTNLWGINISPKQSFEEYVLLQIKFRNLYKAVFENRFVRHFIEATPGLADLMCIGKIYALTDRYDLVIVDAPATGHGLAMLEIPSIVSGAVRVGPLRTESEKINLLLHDDKRTQIVVVTLPEEMPVAETIEMNQALKNKLHLPLGPVFLNQFHTNPFNASEEKEIENCRKKSSVDEIFWKRIELHQTRASMSAAYEDRLSASLKGRFIIPIPFVFSDRFNLEEIQTIAANLNA